MSLNKKCSIFFSLIMITACAKHVDGVVKSAPTRHLFTTWQQDSVLDLTGAQKLKPQGSALVDKKKFTVDSKNWLEYAALLMETGDELGREKGRGISLLGHKLAQSFYEDTRSYTTMTAVTNPPESPYAEIAGYYARPALAKKIVQSTTDALEAIRAAARDTVVSNVPVTSDTNPAVTIDTIAAGLENFTKSLSTVNQQKGDVHSNQVINAIISKIQNRYRQDLLDFKPLTSPAPGQSIQNFMTCLRDRIWQLTEFSKVERSKLARQVERGRVIAESLERVSSPEDELKLLTDLWTAKSLRQEFPSTVKLIFDQLGQKELLALAANNSAEILNAYAWEQVKDRKDFGVFTPRALLDFYLRQFKIAPLAKDEWEKLLPLREILLKSLVKRAEVREFADAITPGELYDDEEVLISLIDNWLALSFRLSIPEAIQVQLTPLTDYEVGVIGGGWTSDWFASLHVQLLITRSFILDGLKNFGADEKSPGTSGGPLARFKKLMSTGIVKSIQARVNMALSPIIENFGYEMEARLQGPLNEQISNAEKIASSAYLKYSRYYLGKKIFGVDELSLTPDDDTPAHESFENKLLSERKLPLLETLTAQFSVAVNKGVKSLKYEKTSDVNQSSASLIGTALTEIYRRLEGLGEFESKGDNSLTAIALQFEIFNKLLALGGFTTASGEKVPGLSISMTPGHVGETLDMENYKAEVSSFAVPDKIFILGSSKLSPASKEASQISLSGQMELLRGLSLILKYSKPWLVTGFDQGLPSLRMNEDPSITAFSKDNFFSLAFGFSSVILRNIQPKMLGLVQKNGDFLEAKNISDFENIDLTAATLSSYDQNHLSHTVYTADIAKAMLAIATFLEVTGDIDKFKSPPFDKRQVIDQVSSGRASARKLLAGLGLFATKFLLQANGGFVSDYNLDTRNSSANLKGLGDQLMMQQALMATGRYLNSDYFNFRAIDNYFFLNRFFWNPALGFYNESEGTSISSVKPLLAILALKNVHDFEAIFARFLTQSPSLKSSLAQARLLEDFLMGRYFSSDDNGNLVLRTLDFSL